VSGPSQFDLIFPQRETVRHLPTWLPGASSLLTAKSWRRIVSKAVWAPYAQSKHSFVRSFPVFVPLHALEILYKEAGSVLLPNTCSTALETIGKNLSADQEEKVVWAVGTMTAGGLETVRRSPSCRKNLSNAQ
jgi:hypothetical protein